MCLILAIQVIVLVAFAIILSSTYTVKDEDLKNAIIVVEEKDYSYEFASGRMLTIVFENQKYSFAKFAVAGTNEYSMEELYTSIRVGDRFSVKYIEAPESNLIIGATLGTTEMRSVKGYNNYMSTQRVISIITFSIVEIVFVATLALFVVLNNNDLKLFSLKAKQKQR